VVQYAKAAADSIGEKLGGKGVVAVTVGSFNETENLVATSFKEEMNAKYPDVTVLDAQEEGFDAAGAIAKAGAIIQGNPDITAAFSTTGNGPTTWSTAAADNNKDLVIISMDYTRPNLDLVKAGKVYGLVAQPLYEEFYQAVVLVGKAIDGPDHLCRRSRQVLRVQRPGRGRHQQVDLSLSNPASCFHRSTGLDKIGGNYTNRM